MILSLTYSVEIRFPYMSLNNMVLLTNIGYTFYVMDCAERPGCSPDQGAQDYLPKISITVLKPSPARPSSSRCITP